MHWNKWSYWLKGGVITLVIVLVWAALIIGCDSLNPNGYACIPFEVISPATPFFFLFTTQGGPLFNNAWFDTFVYIGVWSIIGSFIGVLVGRVKGGKSH